MRAKAYLRTQAETTAGRSVLDAIFGSHDPADVEESVDQAVYAFSGVDVRSWVQVQMSNGFTLVVQLVDGERLFVKFALPTAKHAHLRRTRAMHRLAYGGGFPCAEPISGLLPFRKTYMYVDAYFDPRTAHRVHGEHTRIALAHGLAELTAFMTEHKGSRGWGTLRTAKASDPVWPETDHPAYRDVVRRSHPWLDEIAAVAKTHLLEAEPKPVVGHCDWRMENVRVLGDRIVAIYDWDAVMLTAETTLVATAAVHHPLNWSHGQTYPASPHHIERFVSHYEKARRRRFTAAEKRTIFAAALYAVSVVAKHNYARDPAERLWNRSARQYVWENGERLLMLASSRTHR